MQILSMNTQKSLFFMAEAEEVNLSFRECLLHLLGKFFLHVRQKKLRNFLCLICII